MTLRTAKKQTQNKLFATGLNEPETQDPVIPSASDKAKQKAEILQTLQWAGELGVTSLRMREICPSSLTQRVSDLRKDGHEIECRNVGGYNAYFLINAPGAEG